MAKVATPKKDEPVAVSNHTEKIKSQVLEKVGRPPRLHRVFKQKIPWPGKFSLKGDIA